MKVIDKKIYQWRRVERSLSGRFLGGFFTSRIVIRFDSSGELASLDNGEFMAIDELKSALVNTIQTKGVLPVWIWAAEQGDHPFVIPMIKFAHRLDCQTVVYSDGTGVTQERACLWLESGLSKAMIGLGGLSSEAHLSTIGSKVSCATSAVIHLNYAKRNMNTDSKIELLIPWTDQTSSEVIAIFDWAGEQAVDAISVAPPNQLSNAKSFGNLPRAPSVLRLLRIVRSTIGKHPSFSFDFSRLAKSITSGGLVVYRYRNYL